MISTIAHLLAALAAAGCLYLALALMVVLTRKVGEGVAAALRPEPVTVLKPLHGSEPLLDKCLCSFCDQRYGAPLQIVFGVQDRTDPALAAVEGLRGRYPEQDIAIVIDERRRGTNAKVSNLIGMMAAADHDMILLADSDMLVGEDHVAQTVALLQKPGVGAASVTYCGLAAGGMWSRVSAQGINTHFLPNVLVGVALGIATPCFGSTIALRRQTLRTIGGFEAFANTLADDYAIGEAVRKQGLAVEIALLRTFHVCSEKSLRELFLHQLRWARTVKSIDPRGYLGSVLTHPFAIASVESLDGSTTGLWLAGIALALRFALCRAVERRFEIDRQPAWLVPVTDVLAFAVFFWSFFGTSVSWKRARYDVTAGGLLVESHGGE